MAIPLPIVCETSPRETWNNKFIPEPDLPIRGGWGYTREDACIIDKNDAIVDSSEEFDGIGVEYDFVENRNQSEITESDYWFRDHQYQLISQRLLGIDDQYYDHLIFEITIIGPAKSIEDEKQIKSLNEENQTVIQVDSRENPIYYRREFWFDITSFFRR
ncbi:hypothetical protein [Desulfuromonas thiophila]|uniref:Uncharacterized protein n=1 Tax=Desulfuromonas thiophila TaxID=57664 RepID=A0A1G7DYC0_9BACT|nr:hypothetical protein [Desulfuromonas thiophila]SDE56381.1 hypothetical protein SAMN05661003_11634 [Desulfuromonas thiophila]